VRLSEMSEEEIEENGKENPDVHTATEEK